jgi:1-acyl-sn-glycerol-3-phosphate acyltransferase
MSPSPSRHPLRVLGRLLWLGAELAFAAACLPFKIRGDEARRSLKQSEWMQTTTRRLLRVLHLRVAFEGALPPSGLLVSNHLSYLDILALASLTPMLFVAKKEVKGWPVFGWLAHQGGTLFIQRTSRDTLRANGEMTRILAHGRLLALFPEGTSSDGTTVLPFKSSLLACAGDTPVWPACIHYPASNGSVAEGLCFWKDMSLVPHLLGLLSRKEILARIQVGAPVLEPDRKTRTQVLHARVLALKQGLSDKDKL